MKVSRLLAAIVLTISCHAAAPTVQMSPSGEYSAHARVGDGGDRPGDRFRVIVTITIELSKREIVYGTDVQGSSEWVMLWLPAKDSLIFYAPESEVSSEAYEPQAKYGPFVTRKLTADELALAKSALAEKYGKKPNHTSEPASPGRGGSS